jgi:hypothetical protein
MGKFYISLILLLFFFLPASAHTINYALEKAPAQKIFGYYFPLGIEHIIPYGIDHILFVVALCLLNNKLRSILWQATAFTVAHSITLALSRKNIVVLPSEIVEPIIALSIVFVAVENILLSELKAWRIVLVFVFGLVHGLGFASALNEIGLPPDKFFTPILSFNLGVEIGQVVVILAVFLLLIRPFGKIPFFKKRVVYPLSFIIAFIGTYWTIERLFS